jgi:hypothetical protein
MSTSLARSYPSISLQHTFQLHHISEHSPLLVMLFFNYALQPLRLIVGSWLDVPTFVTRRLHACYHARAPSGGRWNCGQEMSGNFAYMPTSTLHLGIFYMGPTALLPLRRKACWGFFRPKNPTASAGCEPVNLGIKGQHATSRPREPLSPLLTTRKTCSVKSKRGDRNRLGRVRIDKLNSGSDSRFLRHLWQLDNNRQ